jgi:hypothetical protein
MDGLEDVLERLVTDPVFRDRLAADPVSALSGYRLTDDELALLASRLEEAAGHRRVEPGTGTAGLAGLLAVFRGGAEGDEGTVDDAADRPRPEG